MPTPIPLDIISRPDYLNPRFITFVIVCAAVLALTVFAAVFTVRAVRRRRREKKEEENK